MTGYIGFGGEEMKKKNGSKWAQLLKQNRTENSLRNILEYAPAKYKALASEALLSKKDVSKYSLHYIIEYAPDEYKALAQELLNQRR